MLRTLAAVTVIALTPAGALAHHGWSSYDANQVIKVTAPLSNLAWRNPHGTAKVSYKNRAWTVILAPVSRMEARGLSQAMLAGGKPVTLVGYPRSDGTPEMRIERVMVQGKTIELR